MGIKEDLPMDEEINDIQLTKKLTNSLFNLESNEENVMKGIKDLANRMKKSNHEMANYLSLQNETVRLYIQLVNRKSDIINNQDLMKIKEHVKRMEKTVSVQHEIYNSFQEMGDSYKEYHKTLKDLAKSFEKLNKKQKDWHDSAAELSKAQGSQMTSGQKLDKLEKAVNKQKREVMKYYDDRKHRDGFVQHAMVRINQAWIKLKNVIKTQEW
ncbi:hypothetical protein [Candidatus Lokiarchaeum ossiferum]|uniref:hypothetical protein n=1 Tax=Candidatus Lokiarchaeum ossiferum TaxID=2951803 RepID=UPI00352CCC37